LKPNHQVFDLVPATFVAREILIKGGAFATILLNTPEGFNGSFQVFQEEMSAPGPVPKNGI